MDKKEKPLASISLDLDNQWSYMKIHGDEGWDKYPSYLDIFIPHVLELLDELELKITFFIVGKDAEQPGNFKYLQMITERGHEVGNHSYNHESWLQSYSYEDIEKEIKLAETAIRKATGQQPKGFRGPGFSWSVDLLRVLESRGYSYDTSTLPTWLGPLARKYYFWKSNLSKEEKQSRKELFGKFSEGFRPLKPYYWNLGEEKRIMEIPVTTMPFFKTPFHLSYLMYLSRFSETMARTYLLMALSLCRIRNISPSYLLHPLDFIGGDKLPKLSFFPGMDISTENKVKLFRNLVGIIKDNYHLVPMGELFKQFSSDTLESHTF